MTLPLRDNARCGAEPIITVSLIIANMVVFGMMWMHPQGFMAAYEQWGEVPTRIMKGEMVPGTHIPAWTTMFTAMFMHANFGHIFGNMYALWLFGDNVEWLMGRARFLLFYIICGLAASACALFLGTQSDLPGLGASGAIAGVMAAYLLVYPRAKITSLVWFDPFSIDHMVTGVWGFRLRNISAVWFIGSWVVFQLALAWFLISAGVRMNLGIYAHAGGALMGALLVWPLAIQDRKPKPDDYEVCDDLTSPIWGDDGDAGGSEVIVPSLEDQVAKLQERTDRVRTFDDSIADELIAKGDYAGAHKHACMMIEEAREMGDQFREKGYRQLIQEIEEKYNPPPERLKPRESIIPEEKRRRYEI